MRRTANKFLKFFRLYIWRDQVLGFYTKKLTSEPNELSSNRSSELSTISYFKFSKLGCSGSELLVVSEVFILNQMHQENVKRFFCCFLQNLTSHISLISNYYASIIQIENFVVGSTFQQLLPQLFTKVHRIFAEIFINENICFLSFFRTLDNSSLIFKSKQSTNNCPWTQISFII